MESLGVESLHRLRLQIFDNAEALHTESKILFEGQHFSRAFLLSYFCCEELGKIPIIAGVLGKKLLGEPVDWEEVKKRFRNHSEKIHSDDTHHYVFGMPVDLEDDSDLKWLSDRRGDTKTRVNLKNAATYVDIVDGSVSIPGEKIARDEAAAMIERAFQSLKTHWQVEFLTNPIITRSQQDGTTDELNAI